jgi:hypothetical protein
MHPGADQLDERHDWFDGDAGPVVRPYAVTQGRVPAPNGVDVVAFVVATGAAAPSSARFQPEHHALVDAAGEPLPLAELASRVNLPLGVVRVLLGDLRSAGLIALYEPSGSGRLRNVDVLKAVVHGLRAQ